MTFRIEAGVPWINQRAFPWARNVWVEDHEGIVSMHKRGFHLKFEKGCTLSIQWGNFNYCQGYSMDTENWNEESPNAEIALIAEDDGLQDCWLTGDTVQGFCTPEFVLDIIDLLAAPSADAPAQAVRLHMERVGGIIDVEEVKGEIGAG